MSKDQKQVAIVLGGTYPHIHLILLLKKREYHVVLVDYYLDPPAKPYCDKHVQESTLDKEVVIEIARKEEASLVISTCIDQANVTACYVAEALDLPRPYSYATSLEVSDKVLMKNKMWDCDIPTARYITVEDSSDPNVDELSYPLIVKPSDGNSSKGVRRADDADELQEYLAYALEVSRNGKAVIEEFIEGKEIGLDCFIQDGEAHIIHSRERRKIESSVDTIQQIYGSFWPAEIGSSVLARLKTIATQIAKNFDLRDTPLLIQMIYDENRDKIFVLEFAPRIGGGDNYDIIKRSTGFDLIDASIDSFLGNKVTLDQKQSEFLIADNYIYVDACEFGRVENYQHLIDEGTIEYLKIYKKRGMQIGGDISSNNRIGVYIVKSDSTEGLLTKLTRANSEIKVFDVDDNQVMRKDIYQ